MNRAPLAQLLQASRLETTEDSESYLQACKRLSGGTDEATLRAMVACLNDKEAGEIQYELIEACESFPDDVFCKVVLQGCGDAYRSSPYWFDLMFCSMLNTSRLFGRVVENCAGNTEAVVRIDHLVTGAEVDDEFSAKWRLLRRT